MVVSKKEDSIRTIQIECTKMLDLSFVRSDIEAIEKDGVEALESRNPDGVLECLSLFSELLDYSSAPKSIRTSDHTIIGSAVKKDDGKILFGPLIIYNIINNIIKLNVEAFDVSDKVQKEHLNQIISGKEKATVEGTDVFSYLKDAVIKQKP